MLLRIRGKKLLLPAEIMDLSDSKCKSCCLSKVVMLARLAGRRAPASLCSPSHPVSKVFMLTSKTRKSGAGSLMKFLGRVGLGWHPVFSKDGLGRVWSGCVPISRRKRNELLQA